MPSHIGHVPFGRYSALLGVHHFYCLYFSRDERDLCEIDKNRHHRDVYLSGYDSAQIGYRDSWKPLMSSSRVVGQFAIRSTEVDAKGN
jgi:hypothetical protein